MAEERWRVLESELALRHPYVTVRLQEVELPNGTVIPDWPIVHVRDYVNVVALNEVGEVLVLEGYKHGIGRSSMQVVGGYIEEGEDPLEAAKRELLEETGHASDDWRHLGTYVVDANRYVGKAHFYLARNARWIADVASDDLERVSQDWVTVDDVRRALSDGRVIGLGYAANLALALLDLRPPANHD